MTSTAGDYVPFLTSTSADAPPSADTSTPESELVSLMANGAILVPVTVVQGEEQPDESANTVANHKAG